MPRGFPVSLKLSNARCLVVGRGPEAVRRVNALIEAGAVVHWLETGESDGPAPDGVRRERRDFTAADVDGLRLAVLADRDEDLARRMDEACRAHKVLFCAIDQPAWGDFSHVAIVRQGPLSINVSTDGRAPALARRLKDELTRLFGTPLVAQFVDELAALREETPRDRRADVLNTAATRLRIDGRVVVEPDGSDHSNSGKPDSGSGAG